MVRITEEAQQRIKLRFGCRGQLIARLVSTDDATPG